MRPIPHYISLPFLGKNEFKESQQAHFIFLKMQRQTHGTFLGRQVVSRSQCTAVRRVSFFQTQFLNEIPQFCEQSINIRTATSSIPDEISTRERLATTILKQNKPKRQLRPAVASNQKTPDRALVDHQKTAENEKFLRTEGYPSAIQPKTAASVRQGELSSDDIAALKELTVDAGKPTKTDFARNIESLITCTNIS
jgi:hypothetical protein